MLLGNQRSKPNKKSNRTSQPIVSPVPSKALADYIGIDYSIDDDYLLDAFLLSSCGWYIAHMNHELMQREWTLKLDRYPTTSDSFSGLGAVSPALSPWVDIPIYPVTAITNVTVGGDVESVDSDFDSRPPRVFFDSYGEDIIITYNAGYEKADDIPASVLLGIKMMAGYLYEHRGACDIGEAAKSSGAASVWGYNAMILNL